MRVGIVEDELLFREYLRHGMDWTCLNASICWEAGDGEEALKQLESDQPDVILADINMPFMDGLSFASEVKKKYPEVQIVMVTGMDSFDCARKALKIGVKDYLLKPFTKEEFEATMKAVGSAVKMSKIGSGVKGYYPWSYYKNLLSALRASNLEEIKDQLDWLFSDFREKQVDVSYVQTAVQTIITICMSHLAEAGRGIEETYGAQFSPSQMLNHLDQLDLTQNRLLELCEATLAASQKRRPLKQGQVAERAMLIINEQYAHEELSIPYLCKLLFVNESYLRTVFKQNVGMTLSDYITQVRMNEAKRLIEAGGMKFSEIGYSVGYQDPAYFSKCFKKHFGVSPSVFEINSEKYKKPSNSPLSS